jgi:hypothetical protein
MQNITRDYYSYLLRVWKSDETGQPVWRISLQDTRSGAPWFFTSLEAMLEFLQSQVEYPAVRSEPVEQEE